jgi:hypothetical protein
MLFPISHTNIRYLRQFDAPESKALLKDLSAFRILLRLLHRKTVAFRALIALKEYFFVNFVDK